MEKRKMWNKLRTRDYLTPSSTLIILHKLKGILPEKDVGWNKHMKTYVK